MRVEIESQKLLEEKSAKMTIPFIFISVLEAEAEAEAVAEAEAEAVEAALF